jgi:hypothetical protein
MSWKRFSTCGALYSYTLSGNLTKRYFLHIQSSSGMSAGTLGARLASVLLFCNFANGKPAYTSPLIRQRPLVIFAAPKVIGTSFTLDT